MVIQVLNSKLGITYVFRSHLQPSSRPRDVISSLEFKTCMTIKSKVFIVLSRFEFEFRSWFYGYKYYSYYYYLKAVVLCKNAAYAFQNMGSAIN